MIQNIVNSNDPLGEVSIEFVGYGNVTGTVLDDETITFSSPPGNIDGEVVDLAIWLENGTKINQNLKAILGGKAERMKLATRQQFCPRRNARGAWILNLPRISPT